MKKSKVIIWPKSKKSKEITQPLHPKRPVELYFWCKIEIISQLYKFYNTKSIINGLFLSFLRINYICMPDP